MTKPIEHAEILERLSRSHYIRDHVCGPIETVAALTAGAAALRSQGEPEPAQTHENEENYDAATPRPWRANKSGYIYGLDVVVAKCGDFTDKELKKYNADRWNADAALIVAAVNAYPITSPIPDVDGTEPRLTADQRCGIYFVGHPGVCDLPAGHDGDHHFVSAVWGAVTTETLPTYPIPLNNEQERTIAIWAAGTAWEWSDASVRAINLRTFARAILRDQIGSGTSSLSEASPLNAQDRSVKDQPSLTPAPPRPEP